MGGAKETDQSIYIWDELVERALYEFAWGASIYVMLLIMMGVRYRQTKDIALIKMAKTVQSLKNKMFLVSLYICNNTLLFVLCFSNSNYWLTNMRYLSFFYLLQNLVLVLQVRMLRYEYNKKLPFLWYMHNLFWALLTITNFSYMISSIVFFHESIFINIFFDCVRFLITCCQMFYGLKKKQDRSEFESSLTTPLNPSDFKNPDYFIKLKNRESNEARQSKSEILKKFVYPFTFDIKNKIIPLGDTYLYQINVLIKEPREHKYKITKTFYDFRTLEKSLRKDLNSLEGLPVINIRNIPNEIITPEKFLNRRTELTRFLEAIATNINFVTNSFLEFMEFPDGDKRRLKRIISKKDMGGSNEDLDDGLSSRTISSLSNDHDPWRRPEDITIIRKAGEKEFRVSDKKKSDDNRHLNQACIFFEITYFKRWQDPSDTHIEYIFKINLKEKPEDIWEIRKRYSDFIQFDHDMEKQIKAELPSLPRKKVSLNEEELNERAKGLELYLQTVLNEKIYFSPILFDFISLPLDFQKDVQATKNPADFSELLAQIIDTCIMVDEKTKESYTAYLIEIIDKNAPLKEGKGLETALKRPTVVKRFSDFEKLHKSLSSRFDKERSFPSFPSKLLPINNRETILKRKKALEKYLNLLFKVPGIEDSFTMRKFIQTDNEQDRESVNPSVISEREEIENEQINMLNSNHLEELSLATMKFNS